MKRFILVSLLVICFAATLFAQQEVQPVNLPDSVMKQVVGGIVTRYYKPQKEMTEVRIAAENIKKEWLPEIANIKFVLVPADPNGIGPKLHFFKFVSKEDGGYSIGFGFGEPHCQATGDTWYFQVVKGRVKLGPKLGQFGSGCGRGSGDGDSTPAKN